MHSRTLKGLIKKTSKKSVEHMKPRLLPYSFFLSRPNTNRFALYSLNLAASSIFSLSSSRTLIVQLWANSIYRTLPLVFSRSPRGWIVELGKMFEAAENVGTPLSETPLGGLVSVSRVAADIRS